MLPSIFCFKKVVTWYPILMIFKCPVGIPCTCAPCGLKNRSWLFPTLFEWKSKFWFSVWRYKVRDLFFQSSYFAYLTQFICVKCLSFAIITLNLKKEIVSLFCFTNCLWCLLKLESSLVREYLWEYHLNEYVSTYVTYFVVENMKTYWSATFTDIKMRNDKWQQNIWSYVNIVICSTKSFLGLFIFIT